MRAREREKLEREMLRRALASAREALHAFPAEAVTKLPQGRAKSKVVLWVGSLRNIAICNISAILGDVPLAKLDAADPGPYRPNPRRALDHARLAALCSKLGVRAYGR